jgi:uncharacterized protein (TIGR02117 family)
MKAALMHACIIVVSVLLCACASPPKDLFPPDPGELSKTIYLVSHGWHAGIVVKRADIPAGIWPQHNDFPDAEYLEVGWGDMDYYMTPSPHMGITLKAGLLPTASVLHIVGFNGSVTRYFAHSEVIRVELSEVGFQRFCSYLENSYALDEAGRSQPLAPSLYGAGQFYLSRESYHAFNTCNVWTARGLREAGCPITPAENLSIDTLMTNVAKFGAVIQNIPPDLK